MWLLGMVLAAAVFLTCAYLHLAGGVRSDLVVLLWWFSGLASCLCGVEVCRVEDDGIERPRYLGSLVSGLREEWTHSPRG
ncbi:hypothetical protein CLV56_0246 [Mumia flava]|uniref:Uncharacterized protein n=1 Tax=Mumia flava TaxID=1348852 RepID=A0A2M9BDN3_9ACTN|nr:hypothetical protein CLV56_0246 [Mumia flava]